MSDWKHDELAAELLDLRHLAGEIAIEKLALSAGIVDVAAMRLSWTRPRITAYEVKISRADFLADVRAGKYRKYLQAVMRLYFAFPKGLMDPREVPAECGIIVRCADNWWVQRKAPEREIEPARHAGFVQALLFRHYPASWDGAKRAHDNALAEATTPPCPDCSHPLGMHRYGFCRKCKCFAQNWRVAPGQIAQGVA